MFFRHSVVWLRDCDRSLLSCGKQSIRERLVCALHQTVAVYVFTALSLAVAATSIIFDTCLSRQKASIKVRLVCALHQTVVAVCVFTTLSLAVAATSIILDTCLSRQKTSFVATNVCLTKHNFVATKVLSQQAYFSNTCLSRQKWYLWQLPPMILLWLGSGWGGGGRTEVRTCS